MEEEDSALVDPLGSLEDSTYDEEAKMDCQQICFAMKIYEL